jgi:enoyl-CoA hydratase
MSYSYILTEIRSNVGLIRFHRPAVRNALCEDMVKEMAAAIDAFEANDAIGAIVLTGDENAFAAGADISEMAKLDSFASSYLVDFNGGPWIRLTSCRKATIAAVAGYALGGGCELALMCDFILAADTARRWWHATAGTIHWKIESDGDVPLRPNHGCSRGGAGWTGQSRRTRQQSSG